MFSGRLKRISKSHIYPPTLYRASSLTNKKVRGIKRRMRAFERWSRFFDGWFPEGLTPDDGCCHWHLPVLEDLVQGQQAKHGVQVKCAQILINTCEKLIAAKSKSDACFYVTCIIWVPDFFDSQICIFLDEEYLQEHLSESKSEHEETILIRGKSLATDWGLTLPDGIKEIGFHKKIDNGLDEKSYIGEWWYYGEV
jgi:hypothetical protein